MVHLANVHTIVTKNVVSGGDVEEGVRYHELQQIVHATDDLVGRPSDADLALARPFVLRLTHAFGESNRLSDARSQLSDRELCALVLRRRLAGKACGREFDVVAGDLHLLDERVLAGCEPAAHEYTDVIFLERRILLGLVQQGLEVLQRLRTLCNHPVKQALHRPWGLWPARNQQKGTYGTLLHGINLHIRFLA